MPASEPVPPMVIAMPGWVLVYSATQMAKSGLQ